MELKKKRVRKTQLVTTLVLSCFLASFSFVRALEFSPHWFTFTHGAMEQQVYLQSTTALYNVSGGVISTDSVEVDVCNTFDIDLDNYYSGTITLNFSYSSGDYQRDPSMHSIIVVGGKLDALNYTNGVLRIRIYDQQSVQIIMHCSITLLASNLGNTTDPYFKITSTSQSLTAETNHNNVYDNIKSIDTKLTTNNTTLSTIESDLSTANGIYNDILTNTADIEAYLQNIYRQDHDGYFTTDTENLLDSIRVTSNTISTNVNDCETYLNQIKNQVLALQDVIGVADVQNPVPDILTCINTISGIMPSLQQNISNIYTDIHSMTSTLNTINSTLTAIKNALDNIDNTIDNISWNNFSLNSILDHEFNDITSSSSNVTDNVFYIPLTSFNFNNNLNNNPIFYIYLPIRPKTTLTYFKNYFNIDLVYKPGSESYIINDGIEYSFNSIGGTRNRVLIKFNIYYNTSSAFLKITLNNNSNLEFLPSLLNLNSYYILDNDIEYWSLNSYLLQLKSYDYFVGFDNSLYNRLGDIINAINNINVTVNVTSNEITNITNNFDTDINIINNIQNNFGLNFDSYDNQITSQDISLDLTTYNDTIALYKASITSLWNIPFVSIPCLLSAVVFVFLVILG